MTGRRLLFLLLGIAGLALILLGVLILLLPKLLNQPGIKERIVADLARRLQGTLQIEEVELSLFPRPYVTVQGVRLFIPEKTAVTTDSLWVYPRILPLLTGKVQIARLESEKPFIILAIPALGGFRPGRPPKPEEPGKPEAFTLADVREALESAISVLAAKARGLDVTVSDATVLLVDELSEEEAPRAERDPAFWFRNVDARLVLPPGRFEVDVTAASDLADRVLLKWDLDPHDLRLEAHMEVARLQPHKLAARYFAEAPPEILDSEVSANLSIASENLDALRVDIRSMSVSPSGDQFPGPFTVRTGRVLWEGAKVSVQGFEGSLGKSTFSGLSACFDWQGDRYLEITSASATLAAGELYPWIAPRVKALGGSRAVESTEGVIAIEELEVSGPVARPATWDFRVKGEVEDFMVSSPLLPARLSLNAGKYTADSRNAMAAIENLNGRLGDSSFSRVTGWGRWSDEPSFGITSAGATVALGELYPWIQKYAGAEKVPGRVEALEGTLAVNSLQVSGPLRRPALLDFRVSGSVEDVVASSPMLPGPLLLAEGMFRVSRADTAVFFENMAGGVGKTSFSELDGWISWGVEPHLAVESLQARIVVNEIYPWLLSFDRLGAALQKGVQSARGVVNIDSSNLEGPLTRPADWNFSAVGSVENLQVVSPLTPGPVEVAGGGFAANSETLSLKTWNGSMLDASLTVSGDLKGYKTQSPTMDLRLTGGVGPRTTRWMSQVVKLPGNLTIPDRASLRNTRIVWVRGGEKRFSGTVVVVDGPTVTADGTISRENVSIRRLHIEDQVSDATFKVLLKGRELELAFDGVLNESSLNAFYQNGRLPAGQLTGQLTMQIPLDRPVSSTAVGKVVVKGFVPPWNLRVPVRVESASLEARGDKVGVDSLRLLWGSEGVPANISGMVGFSEQGLNLDVDLAASLIEWDELKKIWQREKDREEKKRPSISLLGVIRGKAQSFRMSGYTWNSVSADVRFSPNGVVDVIVTEAGLCGISTPGEVVVSPRGASLRFDVTAVDQSMDHAVTCLWDRKNLVTGTFELDGRVVSRGQAGSLIDYLQGRAELRAKDGRILRSNVLAKIFAVLNVTQIFVGKLPDLEGQGLGYDGAYVKISVVGRQLRFDEAIIDGRSVKIAWTGAMDLEKKTMDLTVLVSPFGLVDAIVGRIPIVGHVLGGSLVTIPVKVVGNLSDPTVIPMSPDAVGSELLGIMKRTVELPLRLLQPLIPGESR